MHVDPPRAQGSLCSSRRPVRNFVLPAAIREGLRCWDPRLDNSSVAVSGSDGTITLRDTVGSLRKKREDPNARPEIGEGHPLQVAARSAAPAACGPGSASASRPRRTPDTIVALIN